MNRGDKIAERLEALVEAKGTNPRAVSLAAGMSPTGVRDIIIRKTKNPKYTSLEKIASALGVSVSDITGEEAYNLRKQRHPYVRLLEDSATDEPIPEKLVDVYDVGASAGDGSLVEDEEIIERLAFPPNYLTKITKTSPHHLAIISVKGDSMEPTLKDDDVVMLDLTKTSLDYDGLFVLRWGDALHVKRVGRGNQGSVKIISDNSSIYPPIDVDRKEVTVVGKVIWKGQKL